MVVIELLSPVNRLDEILSMPTSGLGGVQVKKQLYNSDVFLNGVAFLELLM